VYQAPELTSPCSRGSAFFHPHFTTPAVLLILESTENALNASQKENKMEIQQHLPIHISLISE
jgi:hypothetical protein